ncbi:MAG: SapC family protein [Zavarzinia sp.]|nr:SapC family protein [Zavarzinia sp.]
MSEQIKPAPAAALPLFYTKPEVLTVAAHGNLRVKPPEHLKFAAKANSVPIVAEEFLDCAGAYPIVFTQGPNPSAVAIVGLRDNENLFLDLKGRWLPGMPVPAYVRRYPFIFLELPEQDRLTLCIDRAAPNVVEGGTAGQPLFVDGEASEFAKASLAFCEAYQKQLIATRAFGQALVEHDLLIPRNVDLQDRKGRRLSMGGFQVVNEEKYRALPDDLLLDWTKRGFITAIIAHFISLRRWPLLVERLQARLG